MGLIMKQTSDGEKQVGRASSPPDGAENRVSGTTDGEKQAPSDAADGEKAGRGQTVDGETGGEEHAAKVKRGFATMDKARLHELAVKGGRQAHLNFTGHQFTSEEAREAGRKGGKVCAARKAAAKAAKA